jgi:hypothetical protein
MAQVGAAFGADSFDANHAMADVAPLLDSTLTGQGKAGPAAAGIKLGAGVEQQIAAADAVVAAIGPDLLVAAGEGPLGRGLAGDLEGGGLGALGGQQLAPLGFGLMNGVRLAQDGRPVAGWGLAGFRRSN